MMNGKHLAFFNPCLFIVFICFLSFQLQAQEDYPKALKMEREYRINAKIVPELAYATLDTLFGKGMHKKAKWYREEELNAWNFEAKLKYDDNYYSVEFDSLGTVIDIEVKLDWDDIALKRRTAMQKQLKEKFGRYSIEKIQEQWIGDIPFLKYRVLSFDDYDEEDDDPNDDDIRYKDYQHNYELIIIAKENNVHHSFEVILSAKGDILKISKIIEDNIDHLTY